jgi:hypothetical protein
MILVQFLLCRDSLCGDSRPRLSGRA